MSGTLDFGQSFSSDFQVVSLPIIYKGCSREDGNKGNHKGNSDAGSQEGDEVAGEEVGKADGKGESSALLDKP